MRTKLSLFILAGAFMAQAALGQAQRANTDWTQWRGPNRDGAATQFSVPASWPDSLRQAWKIEVGLGYATPLLVGNRIYMFSRQGENEVMSALDPANGNVIWRTSYAAPFTVMNAAAPHGAGPKSTPIFADGKLYSIGMTGTVTAWDAATGRQLWQKPGSPDNMPRYTTHSFSPLVDNGMVIFHVGGHERGALTAYDMNTGAVKWSWTGDPPGYGSPIAATLGGTRQIVTITQGKIVGVEAATGALLWERPYVITNFTNSITPTLYGETIIVGGTNFPLSAFTVARRNGQWVTENAWENADTPIRMVNGVVVGDAFYSMSTRNSGQYFAVDAKTGRTLWLSEGRQAAHASFEKAGNHLFILEDDGELVVARASTTAFEPLRRYKVAEAATWTQPVLSGNRILVKDVSTLTLWTLN
jgi:outer membrane protein assembly factor BamB